mmetsp:Transcript_6874/g.10448  ORF Transcript_6874/g.10448 Transcript_6874/m.10448 type:complete len:745 (-) Transcript_6874:85-2319(-)
MSVWRVAAILLSTPAIGCNSFSINIGGNKKSRTPSSLHSSVLQEGVRSGQPPPNPVDFLFAPEDNPHYESRLMEYGTMVQEYADEEYGLDSQEYYLNPSGGAQQFFHLYVWNSSPQRDQQQQQQQQQPPLARAFDAQLLCEYSYSTDKFRWESTNPRSIPGFDQVLADLTIRSLQDSAICPTADLFREIINYPFGQQSSQQDDSENEDSIGISCRDSTGDMICWLVSYLILSKQNQPLAIYTAPMNNGEGRAWFLLSNPKLDVPIPPEAMEMHTKTKQLMESALSQRLEAFGLGQFAEKQKDDSKNEEYDDTADTRRFFLERLFSINPDMTPKLGSINPPGTPQFASPDTDADYEMTVWKHGKTLQEYFYSSHELHSYDNFEIVPSFEDPKQFILYFFKEDEGNKMKILQFKLKELCALIYPDQAFWSALEEENDDFLSAVRSLKLRANSDACQPGDGRLFYLISNAFSKGGKSAGLQLQDLQPSVFAQAFEDFGWFFSFLLSNDSNTGIASIPTENIETSTVPDFGGPLQNPGRAWYALEEIKAQPQLVSQTLLAPSHEDYEQAICYASRIQSALMGDLYDITADTNIYLDTQNQQFYCWNDDLKTSVSELKGKRFQLKEVGSFSYSDSTFAFPEDRDYWLKTAIMDLEVRSREKDNSLFVALVDAFRAGGRVGIPNDIGDSIGWLLASICLTKAEEGLSILPDKPLILGKHEMVWYILTKPEHDVGIPSEALAGKKKMQDLE